MIDNRYGQYGVITLTSEQLERSKADVGAFRRLVESETQACLEAMQDQLWPPFIGPIQRPHWRVRLRNKMRALKWRTRATIGRPVHWLANSIDPHSCDCDCC